MRPLNQYKAYLFDLDGTLIDSAGDIAIAVNEVRSEEGLPPLSLASVSAEIGHGAMALIKGCFPGEDSEGVKRIRERFVLAYQRTLCVETKPMVGAEECLRGLIDQGAKVALITNKPCFLGEPLLEQLGWAHLFEPCYFGDTFELKKPDPFPLKHALSSLGVKPSEALFVGDTEVDAEAANHAGVDLAIVSFGRAALSAAQGRWGQWARVIDLRSLVKDERISSHKG